MADILDEMDQDPGEPMTDGEIFTKIWYKPRAVFDFVERFKYDDFLIVLLVIAGIGRAFEGASMQNLGDTHSLTYIVLSSIIGGGLLGWAGYVVFAILLSWTGKMLGGQSSIKSMLRMLAYASIPIFPALFCLLPQVFIFGKELFKLNGDFLSVDFLPLLVFLAAALVQTVLGIWTLVLTVIGTSVIQKFSTGKAILNILLALLIFMVPVYVISQLT